MDRKFADWADRARAATDYSDKHSLAQEIAGSMEAPEMRRPACLLIFLFRLAQPGLVFSCFRLVVPQVLVV